MGILVYLQLAKVVLTWLVYLVISFACIFIRNIIWWKNGTLQRLKCSKSPDNYATSAHKKTIIFMHRLDIFLEVRLSDYILMHHSFISPDYVLRDDVHFMQITEKEAIFVQTTKDSKGPAAYAFSIFGYNAGAKHVITMPIESFNRLADSMGETDAKIIFLQNQSRCGGTLFTEVFKATGRCITFNEPHPLNSACMLHYVRNKWNRPTMVKMLRNIVRLQCKPKRSLDEKTLAYIIKPTAMSFICSDLIKEALPESIQFFIYRHPKQVAISIRRIGEALDSIKLLFYLPNIPNMTSPLLKMVGYCDSGYRGWTPKVSKDVEWGYRLAAFTMKYYLQYREQGVKIHGIRYANLRDYPEKMTDLIFKICNMPTSLVSNATDAFGRDSQAEAPFSIEKLKKLIPNPPEFTPEILSACREISEELQVPGPDPWDDNSFVLPGSIKPCDCYQDR